MRRLLVPFLVASAFLAGLSLNSVAQAARKSPSSYRPLDVFSEVLAHLQNSYVDEVKEQDLVYGAIEGMVGKLDPHTLFMRPDVYRHMTEETTGEFDGVGLELTVRNEQMVVISPIPDSPGERAGIQPGDRLLEIDGAATKDLSLTEAIRRLKGPPGTRIALKIQRDGMPEPRAVTLIRDHIRTQSVESRLLDREHGLAYVRIKGFQDRTDRALKRALDESRAQSGRELQGLVLDLRNNPGGLLDQAVKVSDRFLREGVIVSTEGRAASNREVETARERDTEPDYPIVLMVNRGSASASEIVAGALQDHHRARILGTQSFGKGSVQTLIPLSDGSGLKLTVARYYTPNHRSIHDVGITPDVVVPEGRSAAGGEDGDPQLKAALDLLRTEAARREGPRLLPR
jgi:carboxyl-terminal processing protease